MPVSELEKNPERIMSSSRIKNSNSVELSFNVVGALAGLKLKTKSQRLSCQDFNLLVVGLTLEYEFNN